MSQNTTRHDQHAKSRDEEDVAEMGRHQPGHGQGRRPRQPIGQRPGDSDVSPGEPDDDEFELIGDDDLGAADLGPLGPNATDPDADSGRIRKITRKTGRTLYTWLLNREGHRFGVEAVACELGGGTRT